MAAVVFVAVVASSIGVAGQDEADISSVWDGVYTEAQASRGRDFFVSNCSECHGLGLEGGEGKPLSGDRFWQDWRETTVDYLFGQMSRNMPFDDDGILAGTLATSTYIDIVAYILSFNGLPAGATELTQESAIGIQIIAEDGPGELPNSTLARVHGCVAPRDGGGNWRVTNGSRPVRSGTGNADPSVELGDREFELLFVLIPLDGFVGQLVLVEGLLVGEGGVDGINVVSVQPVSDTCE